MIKFNNLSSKDSKFDAKLVWKEHIDQEKHASYRYSVTANFDFRPLADNYPFDWQHIYISFSISDQDQYGIIQPVPDELIDKDFKVDGWKLIESVSGVLRKQTSTNKGTKLLRKASVVSEARVGWTLARTNSVTVMKVGIPLSFLLFLTYYSLYSGFENFTISIGVLTTCFLSGIALYFSTERPQPLRMTTIDLIFLWYYMMVGITIVVISLTQLMSEETFIFIMSILKIFMPISIAGIIAFLYLRIKSNRLRPKINK